MAHRHKVQKRQKGGRVVYAGAGSNVAKEAVSTENKKRGGPVLGKAARPRLDRRARGGGVGADKSPFSSAFKGSEKGHAMRRYKRGGRADASGSASPSPRARGGRADASASASPSASPSPRRRGGRADASGSASPSPK